MHDYLQYKDSVSMIFDYLGVEKENRQELIEDEMFMCELMNVYLYALDHNIEYCLIDDLFRFDHKNYVCSDNFAIFY